MSKFLVTGGAGFLGKYVTSFIKGRGQEVTALDNFDGICGCDVKEDAFIVDVTDFEQLRDVILDYKPDVIIHLAAYGRNLSCQHFPHKAWNVNVNGTLNVLELARQYRISRVVCCSSNITLSDQPTVYKETKLAVENLVKLYSTLGVSTMALRPSNIYGIGQSPYEYQPCAFAGLDKYYKKHKNFQITGDGTQSRDWVHAYDVARAFYLASFSELSGETLDVCTGKLTSMNEVAKMLGVSVVYTDPRPGDAKELISDPLPAFKNLSFEAKTNLEDGIWDAFPSVKKP